MSKFILQIDEQVRQKLGLFTGLRSAHEDQALYNEAYDRLFAETLRFMNSNCQNLPSPSDTSLLPVADRFTQVIGLLVEVPDWEFRLSKRLNYYLNNWIMIGK